jgi:ankyrin repeat protein
MLSERGIDVNIQNSEGDTALNLCAKNGAKENIRIIQKLFEFKADPSIPNNQGNTFYEILYLEAERNNACADDLSDDEEYPEDSNKPTPASGQNETNKSNIGNVNKNINTVTSSGLLKGNIQMVLYVILPIFILIISKLFEENKRK